MLLGWLAGGLRVCGRVRLFGKWPVVLRLVLDRRVL
jgi:hypothetical protein